MLNWIFLGLISIAALTAAFTGTMGEVTQASVASAKSATNIAISLIGQMALWLGVMRVLEEAGMMKVIARGLRPIMTRLFPEVPHDHPAISAMIMNIAANMLGLANAATPFGIKAMIELNRLNKQKGVATNAMALFLAINTSGVAVLPLGVIAVRGAMGAQDLTGIVLPSMLANTCSTIVAIIVAKTLQRLRMFAVERHVPEGDVGAPEEVDEPIKGIDKATELADREHPTIVWRLLVSLAIGAALVYGLVLQVQGQVSAQVGTFDVFKDILSSWILPIIMLSILLVGFSKRVRVYEAVVDGAKQGFDVAVIIIPFLVAILVAIGMFRASGAMDVAVTLLEPVTGLIGFPPQALPMAIIRPLSGSGALGVITETLKTYQPDSFIGFLVSVMNGSTETTFYVLAVYFGAVRVRAARHTVLACMAADFTGILMAYAFARIFFTPVG